MTKRLMIFTLACLLVILGMGTALAAPDQPMAGHQMMPPPEKPGMMMGDQQQMMSGMQGPGMRGGQYMCAMMVEFDKVLKMAPDKAYYRVGLEDLKSIVDSQTPGLMILDVRPQKAYEMGHILGSLNIPLPMLVEKMSLIQPDTVIYVVCQVDTNAAFAVLTLRVMGYDAYVVPGGVPAWKDKGYPLTMEAGPVQMPQMQQQ